MKPGTTTRSYINSKRDILGDTAIALTEAEVVVSCMRSRGFAFDVAALEDPGILPDGLTGGEAEAYQEALLGQRMVAQPSLDQMPEFVAEIENHQFDTRYNCLELGRWYRQSASARVAIAGFDAPDISDDPVIARLSVEFRECIADHGVAVPYTSPEELVSDLTYLEFLEAQAAMKPEGNGSARSDEAFLEIEALPLDESQRAQLDGLRAADWACSGAYFGGFATRVNQLHGIVDD